MTNEKIFSDVKQFALIFIPVNWVICLVISLILFPTLGSEIGMGYLLGAMTSFLTFGLLMKNTSSSIQGGNTKASVRGRILGGNIARLLISLVVLVVAYYTDNFNFYATIAGLLVLKIILIGFVTVRFIFFKDKKVDIVQSENDQQIIDVENEEVKEEIANDITV